MRIFVCKNKKVLSNVSPKQLKKYLKDKKAAIWVDFEKPKDDEYVFFQNTFNVHALTIEDCKKSIELPKIELFEDYLFIVLHSVAADLNNGAIRQREIDFCLGNNFLVTIHNYKSPSVEHLADKLQKSKKITNRTPDFFMYEIIDFFLDLYFPMIEKWDGYIAELESAVVSHNPPKNILKEIMRMKREVLHMKKSIAPQRDVINKLTRRDVPYVRPLTCIYFRDVYDNIMRVHTELETQRDLLNSTFEAYTSVLSTQMTAASNRMNEVMKKLTIITTIFMPLTFITGVYGMNFRYMPELFWPVGYYIIIGIMITVAVLMFWYFRKKKWM